MSTLGTQDGGAASQWGADQLIPFGKYLLLNRLSVGATAAVYRAKIQGEAGFERVVAIKRILPHMAGDPAFVETFVREAKIAARLNHTNICPIYELGKVGESIYMAMECVAGKDLGKVNRALAAQGQTMPPAMCAWVASRLCEALDYAHTLKDARGKSAGIIHRDLSPTNIVISYEGGVKLIDFGVAKATGRAQQTNVDALKKKLGYMSPEMVRGKTVDHRSDVFGVGVTLFEMVTGQRLFSGKDDMATLGMVGKAAAPSLSDVIDDVPSELEAIVTKALAREPEDRYQNCGDMNDALVGYLAQTAPTYGTRQLAQWMEATFAREMEQERRQISELLEASNQPGMIEERRRYFASPLGAAAAARAQMGQKLSLPPGPAPRSGSSKPPTLPTLRSKPVSGAAKPAGSPNPKDWNAGEIDSLVDDNFERISKPPQAPRPSHPSARPAAPGHNPAADEGFDDEATGFYDPGQAVAAGVPVTTVPATKPAQLPTPAASTASPAKPASAITGSFYDTGGFDEDATQIFFNKDEDIGISELMEEDIAQQQLNPKPLAVHRPGEVRVAPPPPRRSIPPTSVPPQRSMPPSAQVAPAHSLPVPVPASARTMTPQPFRHPVQDSLPPAQAAHQSQLAPAVEARRAHTLRMQAAQPPPKERNTLIWVGAGLLALAAALAIVVWLRNPGVGAIEVRTVPLHARVLLDGIHRGEAPLRLDGVHAGTRRLEIRAEGYETMVREIELQKGSTAMLDIVLTKPQPAARPPAAVPPTPAATPSTAPSTPAPSAAAPAAAPAKAVPAAPARTKSSAPARPPTKERAPASTGWQPPPPAPSGASWAPPSR